MKIANLLEMTTPSSDTSNMGGSQSPKFGRDPHILEDEKIEETTAGSVATGEPTNMGMQRRGKGSMFQGIKTSKKFVNSPVTEAEKDPEQEKIDSLRRSRQEKERGSERELGRDPKPTGQYYVMINGASYKKDGETVMFNSSIEAHRAIERITAFRKSKGWGTARYQVIQQKGMEEALDPKALSTLRQAKQSIAKNREADVASWEQDFRKNFAAKYGSQMPPVVAQRPLNIPATKPAPKPLEKHSVLKNRMAKLNRVIDNQKYLDYLTFKAEQKGLLNPRLAADIDTSLYVKGAEKDDYEALSQKIDKSIELIKNRLGVNKLAYKKPMREEGVAEGSDRKDMTGQTCEKCKKGKYQERSQHDDMEGKVTCSCGHRVNRWKNYKDQDVAEGSTFPGPLGDREWSKVGRQIKSSQGRDSSVTSPHQRKDWYNPKDPRSSKQQKLDYLKSMKAKQGVAEGLNEFSPSPGFGGNDGDDDRNRRLRKLLQIAIQVAEEQNVGSMSMVLAMNTIAGDDFFSVAVEGLLRDITDREYTFVLQSAYKKVKQGNIGKGQLEETYHDDDEFFEAYGVAKAGREGASEKTLDAIRDKHDNYNEDVMEADLSEEHLMTKDLFKRFDLFKQGKDRELGNKPSDKEIMAKEEIAQEVLPISYIKRAIYNVLLKKYPQVVKQYGEPIVKDAVSSIANMHKDMTHLEAEEASIILHQVINQLNRHLQMREEKQRLDPSCWDNKKIGNPKTKVKGGVRVNNCVPK